MKAAILGLALAAAVLVGVVMMRGGSGERISPQAEGKKPEGSVTVTRRHAPDVVLAIKPGAPAALGAVPQGSKISPLMQDFAQRREYRPIYDQLRTKASPTGEESYVLAEILDNCATVADRSPPRRSGWKLGGQEARERFIAALGDGDSAIRAKRIAAFDKMNVDPCAGFESVTSTRKEIRELLQRSAAAGDAKGKAMLLYRELELEARDASEKMEISDTQLDTLKQVLASKDPRALVDVANVFGYHLSNLSLRTGPERAPLDYYAFHGAATLAACELGYPCGPDSRTLLQACALQGQCEAASYRDYLFFYYLSPSTSQLAAEYHQHLTRGIQQGDWSYFTFHRGPAPTYAPFQRR